MYSRVNTSHSIFQQFYTRDIRRPNEKSLSIPEQPTILSANSRRTGKTRRLYSRKPGERIHPTLALPILVTLFLCWEKGWEVPTSGRLQEAKFIHSARSIPPAPYPRVSG